MGDNMPINQEDSQNFVRYCEANGRNNVALENLIILANVLPQVGGPCGTCARELIQNGTNRNIINVNTVFAQFYRSDNYIPLNFQTFQNLLPGTLLGIRRMSAHIGVCLIPHFVVKSEHNNGVYSINGNGILMGVGLIIIQPINFQENFFLYLGNQNGNYLTIQDTYYLIEIDYHLQNM